MSYQRREPRSGDPAQSGLGYQFGVWVADHPFLVLALCLLLAGVVGSGASKLGFNQDYRAFFSDDNPELNAFEQMQQTYARSDTLFFTIKPNEGQSVFEPAVAGAIRELTDQAWQLPFSIRVDSVANFQNTYAEDDDLIVEDLMEDPAQIDANEFAAIRDIALSEPALIDLLVDKNANVTGVLVTFNFPGKTIEEMPSAANGARELVAAIEANYPVSILTTGTVMVNDAFVQSSADDAMTLVPLMYLMIILITWLLLRSVWATLATLAVLILSVVTGMGGGGWAGILLTPPSASAPTIITTLAVADSIHYLVTLLQGMRRGLSKRDAVIESMRVNLQPIFLTSLTTAVGFLTMNLSDAPPFNDLGNITAIGVVAAFVFSVSFLPALVILLPLKVSGGEQRQHLATIMADLVNWTVARKYRVLLVGGLLSASFIALIPLNNVNDNLVGYFDETTQIRQHTDATVEQLTGVYQVQFSLDAGDANGVSDPEFIQKVDVFAQWLREQPETMHVLSISDTFKRLNRNLHGDDDAFHRIPDSRESAAQYLLLYEMSLPFGLDLNNQLSADKSSTRIIATVKSLDSSPLIEFSRRAETWLQTHTGLTAIGIGPPVMFAYISERNIESMFYSTGIAIVAIALIIMLALRSIRIGLISLIPNLLPAAIAFGVWAIFVGQVNVAVSAVLGMTLGIVVDDAVHILSKYMRARRDYGYDAHQSLVYAFEQVGPAIVVTTVILTAGFSVLAQSTFAMNEYMATLTAITVVVALVADVFLLPVLLVLLDRRSVLDTDPSDQVSVPTGTPLSQSGAD